MSKNAINLAPQKYEPYGFSFMSKKGSCGINCETCILFPVCGGCNQFCYGLNCFHNLKQYRDCSSCTVVGCPGQLTRPSDEAKLLLDFVRALPSIQIARLKSMPSFIPIVPVDNNFWKETDINAVMIKFSDLLESGLWKEAVEIGDIHKALDFHRTVIYSSIMPDELLTDETFEKYKHISQLTRPDAILTWDLPVYADDPRFCSWFNLLQSLKSVVKLADLNIPLIGLVKGAIKEQVNFSCEAMSSLGLKDLAFHCSEFLRAGENQLLLDLLRTTQKACERLIAIGASSPAALEALAITKIPSNLPRPIVCGLTWHIAAKHFRVFSKNKTINVRWNMVKCHCRVCEGKEPESLGTDFKQRSFHNLEAVQKLLKGISDSMESWDLILDKKKVIFVSDLHTGTKESLWRNCLDFIQSESPDYTVFLGDTFDFLEGLTTSAEVYEFFTMLREINTCTVPVFGSHDLFTLKLMSALRSIIFGKDQSVPFSLLEGSPEPKLTASNLLLRFYLAAKKRLQIRFTNGTMLALHGNRLSLAAKEVSDLNEPVKLIEKTYKKETDWIVCAHSHVAALDQEKKIISLGCWQLPTSYLISSRVHPNPGVSLIIEKDGTLELKDGLKKGR